MKALLVVFRAPGARNRTFILPHWTRTQKGTRANRRCARSKLGSGRAPRVTSRATADFAGRRRGLDVGANGGVHRDLGSRSRKEDPERANYPSPWHAVARRTERARALDPTAKSTNRQTARHQLMHNALYARARVPSLNAPTVSPRLTPSPNLSRSVFPSLPGRPRRFEEFSNCIILKLLLKGVQGEK